MATDLITLKRSKDAHSIPFASKLHHISSITDARRSLVSPMQDLNTYASSMALSKPDLTTCNHYQVCLHARSLRAKLYNRKRFAEKVQMRKQIKLHEQKETKNKREDVVPKGAVPAYLLDRSETVFT